jgi:ATP-dependent Clp protease protease subunit
MRIKDTLNNILCKHTGQKADIMRRDTDRNFYMSAEEAKEYGVIDEILTSRD